MYYKRCIYLYKAIWWRWSAHRPIFTRWTNGLNIIIKNGARLNTQNGLGPVSPEFINLSDVDQIEILKGPASVQYGSDAISGVVQLISNNPTKSGASLTGVYGENRTYKTLVNADYVDDSGFMQVSVVNGWKLMVLVLSIYKIKVKKQHLTKRI